MPTLDTGREALTPRLPWIGLIGLFLIPAEAEQASNDLTVAMTPGVAILDDHAQQIAGRGEIQINAGNTLSASSEVISDVVVYWNPEVRGIFVVVVDGAEALTSAGAEAPTDAEIEAALPDSSYTWARVGRVKFSRDAGTAITLEYLDHTVRPMNVDPDDKDATAAAYQETDVTGADAELYEFSHTERVTVDAADIANGDLLSNKPVPPFYGKIGGIRGVVEATLAGAGGAANVNAEIGAADVTGGVVALATADARATVKAGSEITAANTFKPGDTWSLEASGVVAFTGGRAAIEVDFYRLRTV